jgi:hypothetical protein
VGTSELDAIVAAFGNGGTWIAPIKRVVQIHEKKNCFRLSCVDNGELIDSGC